MMFSENLLLRLDQRWLISVICLVGALALWGIISISSGTPPLQRFSQNVAYYSDSRAELTIEEAVNLPPQRWKVEQAQQLSFGMADHPFWFRFVLPAGDAEGTRLLEVDYAMLDNIHVWFYVNGNLLTHTDTGDNRVFAERTIPHEKLLFEVPYVNQPVTVFMKVQTSGTVRLPIRLWDKEAFALYNGEHNLVMGLFFGFMLAMALSNLFFYVTTRSLTFLTYSGYVVCLALTLATLHGLAFKYLWPDSVWLQGRSVGIFGTGTILFALVFSIQLLDIKANSRLLFQLVRATAWVFAAATLLSLIIPYAVYIKVYLVLLLFAVLLIYGSGLTLWYRKVPLARFYTIAWTALLVSGFVTSLDNANIINMATHSHYLLMFGASIETFLLALALAMSYSKQRQELDQAQQLALVKERMATDAKDQLLKAQEKAQEELEYKVQERTLELEIALRELSETNRELEKRNTTDALTNIRNRHYFDKKYLAEVRRSRREQTELSLAMLDVDHFKQINDKHGHLVGDECIRFVADVLKGCLKRPSDDACRYGGEEFAILLPNTDQEGAVQLVEEIRKKVECTPLKTSVGALQMTVSAGVCTGVIRNADDEQALIANADKALYQAKKQGRNRVIYNPMPTKTAVNQE